MIFLLIFSIIFTKKDKNFYINNQNSINQTKTSKIDCYGDITFIFQKNGLNLTWYRKNEYYQYDEIVKYQIIGYSCKQVHFYLDELNNDSPKQYIDKIIPLLRLQNFVDVYFHDYLNGIAIESSRQLFVNKVDVWIVLNVENCYWENKKPNPINLIDNETYSHWKKVCLYNDDGSSYSAFFYNDDEYKIINYIPKKHITLVISIAVVIIIIVIISLFLIGLYRYKKDKAINSRESL